VNRARILSQHLRRNCQVHTDTVFYLAVSVVVIWWFAGKFKNYPRIQNSRWDYSKSNFNMISSCKLYLKFFVVFLKLYFFSPE